jgi:hypothetical protein
MAIQYMPSILKMAARRASPPDRQFVLRRELFQFAAVIPNG